MFHHRSLNPENAYQMIIVTDELVWKEDMVDEEEEEEGDWEECSDEDEDDDDSEEDGEGDEAPDLVDIDSTKKVRVPANV